MTTETKRLPKCRQSDQGELFDSPRPQPLDVATVLSGRVHIDSTLQLKHVVILGRADGDDGMTHLAVVPLEGLEEADKIEAVRIYAFDVSPDDDLTKRWEDMPAEDKEQLRQAWERWISDGARCKRRDEDQKAWRGRLLEATAELTAAQREVELRKRALKNAKEDEDAVQARVNRLAGDADGCEEWPWGLE